MKHEWNPEQDAVKLDRFLHRDGQMAQATKELAEALNQAKEQWLDGLMEKILPPEMVFKARSENPLVRAEVHKWLLANKVLLVEREDKTELVRDQTVLGELVVTMADGKWQVNAKELLEKKDEHERRT